MKLLIWTLIEIITLLVFSGCLLVWLKKKHIRNENTLENATKSTDDDLQKNPPIDNNSTPEDPAITLKRFVNNQIMHAAKQLTKAKSQANRHKALQIKLWGTLLKAESRVLDTPDKKETEEILKKHLSDILSSIFSVSKGGKELKELKQKLAKLVQSANQSNNVLELKIELEKAQDSIKKELVLQIKHSEDSLGRLSIKKHEKDHLELTLSSAINNVNQLKQTLANLEQENEFEDMMAPMGAKSTNDPSRDVRKHKANKQVNSLNQIANRQQIVIDLLREKLREASKEELINIDESQEIAVSRIEQMIKESDTLIIQLENELGSTSLSIKTLKADIKDKSKQLVEKEKQLIVAKKTASASFRESAKNQQSKVDDMKHQISNAPENNKLDTLIKEQQKESDTLERLLKESETCVTVLELELESARKTNKEIQHTIETVDPEFQGLESDSANNKFQQLESDHNALLKEHSHVKQQLLASINQEKDSELKNEFNRKNLEIDRLQLAINDLEKKQQEKAHNLKP